MIHNFSAKPTWVAVKMANNQLIIKLYVTSLDRSMRNPNSHVTPNVKDRPIADRRSENLFRLARVDRI